MENLTDQTPPITGESSRPNKHCFDTKSGTVEYRTWTEIVSVTV